MTTQQQFQNFNKAVRNLWIAIIKSKQFEYFEYLLYFCLCIASLWLAAAMAKLFVKVIVAGWNWEL